MLFEKVTDVIASDEMLVEVYLWILAISIDEQVVPLSLLYQMFGVWQTILPTGGIKTKFNAIIIANLNVLNDEIDDTVLRSLGKVLNFVRLNF